MTDSEKRIMSILEDKWNAKIDKAQVKKVATTHRTTLKKERGYPELAKELKQLNADYDEGKKVNQKRHIELKTQVSDLGKAILKETENYTKMSRQLTTDIKSAESREFKWLLGNGYISPEYADDELPDVQISEETEEAEETVAEAVPEAEVPEE
jgi:hypothetical protein